MKILLFGRQGQVGSGLELELAQLGEVTALGRHELDLTDRLAIEDRITALCPDLIVNAAAYTAVDRAESEPDLAAQVNTAAPACMARAGQSVGAFLVHFSTDYVFSGDGRSPYSEASRTDPRNVYGRTKLDGEQRIRSETDRYLILRTSWVYSHTGSNFLLTMLRLAAVGKPLRVVADQIGAPTYAPSLSAATAAVLRCLVDRKQLNERGAGLYHMSCRGQTSWHGFAEAILEAAGLEGVQVLPITTPEYPTPAARPAYSVLDNARLEQEFSVRLPDWRDSLAMCMRAIGDASRKP